MPSKRQYDLLQDLNGLSPAFDSIIDPDDGTEYSIGVDIPASGGGGGLALEAAAQAATIYKSGADVVYDDHIGESGSIGTTTYSTVNAALEAAASDYDGGIDNELGAIIQVAHGVYTPDGTVDVNQGVKVHGVRDFYSRSPSSPSGGEWLTKFETTDMPAGAPFFRMRNTDVSGDAKGAGVYGIDFVGGSRTSNTNTGVVMGQAGRTVVALCTFDELGGNGIHAVDSFSAHAYANQGRNIGQYDEDASLNETGTNFLLSEVEGQNVNMNAGGNFCVNGPGAGTATSNLPDGLPSIYRTTGGASMQLREIGGIRSGGKLRTLVGHADSVYDGRAAVVKGDDIRMYDQLVTGENDDNVSGVIMQGGPWEMVGCDIEKQGINVLVENVNEKAVRPWSNVIIDNATIAGVRVSGATVPPCNGWTVTNNAIGIDVNTGSFRFTGCRFDGNTTALDNDGADGGVESLVNCEFSNNTTDVTSSADLTTNLESA